MRRLAIILILAALATVGCQRDRRDFATMSIGGRQCYMLTYDEETGPWGTTMGLKKTLALEWPKEGRLTPAAERELMWLCFGDSTSANVDMASRAWLAKPYIFEDDGVAPHVSTVDSLDESREYCYVDIACNARCDSALATFIVKTETYAMGAHGYRMVDYLTVDLASGNAVHLADLVTDTTLLCDAVARAIQDLEVNKDIRPCLYDEFRDADRMPMPRSFVVDSARNGITVVYGLYDIQPYAYGIPSVVLPIYWLSKHVALTPYAKRLFGPGSYIHEQ